MGKRDPSQKPPHTTVFVRRKNHMPVVVHPLIGDQMNWKFLQRLRDNAIECCIVLFLEKDGGLGIATVERVINAAGFIGEEIVP